MSHLHLTVSVGHRFVQDVLSVCVAGYEVEWGGSGLQKAITLGWFVNIALEDREG